LQNDHEWLLGGPPWVEYNTRRELLHQSDTAPEVIASRQAMTNDPQIQKIVSDLKVWPWKALNNHKSAGHPIHMLTFLADVGLNNEAPGMESLIAPLLEHQSAEGPFQTLINIPKAFGGSGMDQYSWQLCDAPLLCYSFAKLGLQEDSRVLTAIQYLVNLVRENGWLCAASKDLGKFHGPGKKGDPCPFATLVMLKTLALYPQYQTNQACYYGIDCLLDMWENSLQKSLFLFRMGTNFRKLKAPLVWFDIVHVLDVLSQFEYARQDKRFQDMLAVAMAKQNNQGRFTPESIWTVWKGWDFGQKREPSRWLTFLIYRIIHRVDKSL